MYKKQYWKAIQSMTASQGFFVKSYQEKIHKKRDETKCDELYETNVANQIATKWDVMIQPIKQLLRVIMSSKLSLTY